jgi:hypothetical protein
VFGHVSIARVFIGDNCPRVDSFPETEVSEVKQGACVSPWGGGRRYLGCSRPVGRASPKRIKNDRPLSRLRDHFNRG